MAVADRVSTERGEPLGESVSFFTLHLRPVWTSYTKLILLLIIISGWVQSSVRGYERKKHTFAFLYKWYFAS